jgi:hypothetical protein
MGLPNLRSGELVARMLSAGVATFRASAFLVNAFYTARAGARRLCIDDNNRSTPSEKELSDVQSHDSCKGLCSGCMRPGHRVVHHWHGRQFHTGRVGPTIRNATHSHIVRGCPTKRQKIYRTPNVTVASRTRGTELLWPRFHLPRRVQMSQDKNRLLWPGMCVAMH